MMDSIKHNWLLVVATVVVTFLVQNYLKKNEESYSPRETMINENFNKLTNSLDRLSYEMKRYVEENEETHEYFENEIKDIKVELKDRKNNFMDQQEDFRRDSEREHKIQMERINVNTKNIDYLKEEVRKINIKNGK